MEVIVKLTVHDLWIIYTLRRPAKSIAKKPYKSAWENFTWPNSKNST